MNHVDHLNIVVTDLFRSIRFYTEALDFTLQRTGELTGDWIETITGVTGVSAEVAFLVPPSGAPRIELLQYHAPKGANPEANSAPNTVGLRHLAFRVDDMDAAVRKVEKAGATLISPPTTVPGAVITHDHGRKTLCYFHDPDGVLLELASYS